MRNTSIVTVSHISLGWVPHQAGPGTLPTKRGEHVVLRLGSTTVFNFDSCDGPSQATRIAYCVRVTDVAIDTNYFRYNQSDSRAGTQRTGNLELVFPM